ncbi:MAG: SCO family protein [Bacteroidota bacterium]
MKRIITLILWILIISCTKKQEKSLPFYHTADFTPQWIADTSQLDTLHTLANFEFTNQNNQKITQENLRGKIHVACFFFTICPSLCPKIMGNMKMVQDSLKNDKSFLIASYSVMPERDSVSALRKYATENQIIDNKWHLLTGDKKQIYQLARKSYFADENLGVQKGVNDFLHTENFILVDKNLHIRGIYNGTLSLEIEQLIKDIRVLEKE